MRIDGDFFVVGERRYPIASRIVDDTPMPGISSNPEPWTMRTRNVHLWFESGYIVSVSFGSMTYSDNHDAYPYSYPGPMTEFIEEPETVEVGVFHKDHKHLGHWGDGDSVIGYCNDVMVQGILDLADRGVLEVTFDDHEFDDLVERLNRGVHDTAQE